MNSLPNWQYLYSIILKFEQIHLTILMYLKLKSRKEPFV